MRERARETGSFSTEYRATEAPYPSGSVFHTDYSYGGQKTLKEISDYVTPDFRALLKCGAFLPLNPVRISEIVNTRKGGTFNGVHNSSIKVEGNYFHQVTRKLILPPASAETQQQVVNSAAARAASSQFDYLTFLAEMKESVDTMAGIATVFNTQMTELAQKAVKASRNPWKKFRELWLGARYGVRPLIIDAKNISQALATKVQRKLLKGQDRSTENLQKTMYWEEHVNARYLMHVTETITGKYEYRGCAFCETDLLVQEHVGGDPLVTAWELVPYSFVVDWFVDVGSWVQTIRPRVTGGYLGIGASLQTTYTHRVACRFTTQGGFTGSFDDNVETFDHRHYVRDPAAVAFPPVIPDLTLATSIDLAALFIKGRNDVFRILRRR